jgi:phytoene desaturase
VRRGTYAPSAVVWHAGVRGAPSAAIAHHNIHFGEEWEPAFRSLIDDGRCMPDPSVLVTVPSVSDPTLAPAGDTVVYALEPVPNLKGRVAWADERVRARDRLAARLAAAGYPSDVVVERLVDPTDWAAAGMAHGTPFGLAHHFFQSGPFRPANLERRAPGLVFVGAGTVPGIGVPLVLISGRLAADRVEAS